MSDLKTTAELVKKILEERPEARNSDYVLYSIICEKTNKKVLSLPFDMVLSLLDKRKIPNFETIRRTRQKVQEEFPELKGSKKTRQARAKNEVAFREFARGNLK